MSDGNSDTQESFSEQLQSLIAEFQDTESRGEAIDREAWIRHLDACSDALREFLSNHERRKAAMDTAENKAILPPRAAFSEDVTLPPRVNLFEEATLPSTDVNRGMSNQAAAEDRVAGARLEFVRHGRDPRRIGNVRERCVEQT